MKITTETKGGEKVEHIVVNQIITENEAIRIAEKHGLVVVMIQEYDGKTDIWCVKQN